jgi:hypothetical protein
LDLNQRPSGYEPDELPLLHPATLVLSGVPCTPLLYYNGSLLKIQSVDDVRVRSPD